MIRKILRIARWEVSNQLSTETEKYEVVSVTVLLLLAGSMLYFGVSDDFTVEQNMYSVAVPPDSDYVTALEGNETLVISELDQSYETADSARASEDVNQYDLVIYNTNGSIIYSEDDSVSQAALSQVNTSIESYNISLLIDAGYDDIAEPILVNLIFEDRESSLISDITNGEEPDNGDDEDTGDEENNDEDSGNGEEDSSNGESDGGEDESTDDSEYILPDDINPPFPIEPIVLGFLFLVPINFVAQTYATSVYDDRLSQGGEMVLATPVSPTAIVIGKMLPYFLGLLGISVAIALFIGTSVLSIIATSVIIITFLSIGFITGITTRSYRELTFVFLTITLVLFIFIIIPAIFSDIHPIAIISPLTLIVYDIQSTGVTAVDIIFALGPTLLAGLVLFKSGINIYREEDLFTQRRVKRKILDMIAEPIRSWKSTFYITIFLIPIVFIVQLLSIALLFGFTGELAILFLGVIAALSEEIAKSISVYAGSVNRQFISTKTHVLAGAASGIGFFIGEQVFTITQFVGLTDLEVGSAVFHTFATDVIGTELGIVLPIIWILIHPITAIISSYGASRGFGWYIVGLLLATGVHVLYNAGVVFYV